MRARKSSISQEIPTIARDLSRDSCFRPGDGMYTIIRDSSFFPMFSGVILNEFRSERFCRRQSFFSHDGTLPLSIHYLPCITMKIIDWAIYDIDICARVFYRLRQKEGSLYTPLNFVKHASFNGGL